MPSADREELMRCRSTPWGSLRDTREGTSSHILQLQLSVFIMRLLSAAHCHVFVGDLLVFPSEASWNHSVYILSFLVISFKSKSLWNVFFVTYFYAILKFPNQITNKYPSTWYQQITFLGGHTNILGREVIDVQVDPPAVWPHLNLRNSTLVSYSLLWLLLTVKWRQKRRLCEAGPGEGVESSLGPVDPVQIAGLQEGRKATVLWEYAA